MEFNRTNYDTFYVRRRRPRLYSLIRVHPYYLVRSRNSFFDQLIKEHNKIIEKNKAKQHNLELIYHSDEVIEVNNLN